LWIVQFVEALPVARIAVIGDTQVDDVGGPARTLGAIGYATKGQRPPTICDFRRYSCPDGLPTLPHTPLNPRRLQMNLYLRVQSPGQFDRTTGQHRRRLRSCAGRVALGARLGAGLLCALLIVADAFSATSDILQSAPALRIETGTHSGPLRRLAVSEARGLLVTASDDKTARVWDLRTGRPGLVLRPPIGSGDIGRLYGAAAHPSQALVAVGGTSASSGKRGAIYLFDLDSGRLVRAIDAGTGDIKRLAWSADGTVLLAGYAGAGAIRAFSIDGRLLHDEPGAGAVYGLAVGPRGLVGATDFTGRVVLLRAANQSVQHVKALQVQQREPIGVAFSPDEQTMVVGYNRPLTQPDVVDVASGRIVRQLQPDGAVEGQFGVVSWSRDGQTIAVGGSASPSGRRFPVWLFGGADTRPKQTVEVAGNSVLDLAALSDGRFAFSSFDGSWGVVGSTVELQVAGEVNDLRGAASLEASGDVRRIGWAYGFGAERASFDLATRVIAGAKTGMKGALTRRSLLDSPLQAGFDAQGSARKRQSAQVNGVTITFDGVELGSCGTYLHHSRDAFLGTSKALYRIDGEGRTVWRLPTAAEVNAVVASDDDRLIVTAMSDGVIQWRRASDGTELLSFLARRDGRWIIWTPEGYFDASAGAETMAGWVVNRGEDSAAELFSLGRFRDRYNRPDVIDRVLETLDTRVAIEQAPPTARPTLLAAGPLVQKSVPATVAAAVITSAPASAAPERKAAASSTAAAAATDAGATTAIAAAAETVTATALSIAPPSAREFPPSLVALGTRKLPATGASLEIPFALRAAESHQPPELELRIDGRPLSQSRIQLPAQMDGKAKGLITFDLAAGARSVVLLARDGIGVSEPLSFAVERQGVGAASEALPPGSAGAPKLEEVASAAAPATAAPPPQQPAAPAASSSQVLAAPNTAASHSQMAAVAVAAASRPQATSAPASAALQPATTAKPSAQARPAPAGRTLYVLAIGISEYERPAYRLGLPAKDATDFVRVMSAQKTVYRDVTSRLLTNSRANRQAIRDGLKWLVEAVGPDDVGMLFLAGHGVNQDNGQYYFLNYEANHEQLDETGLSEREIRDALREIRGRTLFFVDTCFAGNVIGDARTSSREISRMANTLASAENGVVVFAASSGRQESEEKADWGNGAFTKVLVEGLRGEADLNRTGRITFKGLDFYVSEEVRQLTQDRQTPVTIIPVGVPDFVVAAPI
jgi:WD40 repeat protein